MPQIEQFTIENFCVNIIRKPIKNIYLRLAPGGQEVVVSAPLRASSLRIKKIVESKLHWIKSRQNKSRALPYQNLPDPTHNTVLFLDKTYPLVKTSAKSNKIIGLIDNQIAYCIQEPTSPQYLEVLLDSWYRGELFKIILSLAPKWEAIIGVKSKFFGIRLMKTRWGSCNTTRARIWLNLHLIQKPINCIEYVLVHELVHLREASHNHRFQQLMDQFLPDWRLRKKLLNST